MKKTVVCIFAGLLIVSGVLIWNPSTKSKPAVALAESNGCGLTMLNGTYGFAFSGYFNSGSSDAPAYTPLAAAGTITFRPGGTLNRTFNISFVGRFFLSAIWVPTRSTLIAAILRRLFRKRGKPGI
jgi:hypothetical protein